MVPSPFGMRCGVLNHQLSRLLLVSAAPTYPPSRNSFTLRRSTGTSGGMSLSMLLSRNASSAGNQRIPGTRLACGGRGKCLCSHLLSSPRPLSRPFPVFFVLHPDDFPLALEVEPHRPVINPVCPVLGEHFAGDDTV